MERMRIKLSKEDIDIVFDYLDKDKDENISYNEFTEFSEEKRRKIDPFMSFEHQRNLAMDKEFGDRMHLLKQIIFITRKLDEKHSNLAEAFKTFDHDRDGEVSKKEFT